MSAEIRLTFETSILPGELEAFQAVGAELIAKTEADDLGVLVYQWYLSEDKSACCVLECYRDSEAVLEHLETLSPFVESLLKLSRPIALKVYGNPSEGLREALKPMHPIYFPPMAGFSRVVGV